MSITLAFDVYGTLIDTHGVVTALRETVGDKAERFSQTWRDKQLEYSFRRGLMQQYENFAVCTRQALDYTCEYHQAPMTSMQKTELLGMYRELPAFADAETALQILQGDDFQCYAFSNGTAEAVDHLLSNAHIRQYFRDVVSVDDLQTFKPHPAVYAHLVSKSGADISAVWMISSNPFDVIGAMAAGLKAAWVQRSEANVFDPWGVVPTITVSSLVGLGERIMGYEG